MNFWHNYGFRKLLIGTQVSSQLMGEHLVLANLLICQARTAHCLGIRLVGPS